MAITEGETSSRIVAGKSMDNRTMKIIERIGGVLVGSVMLAIMVIIAVIVMPFAMRDAWRTRR